MILQEKPLFVIRKPHEEIMEGDVRAAFERLIPSQKEEVLCLRDIGSVPFTHMTQACAENSFGLSTNPPIHGLSLLHSRFNHSCIPNSKVPTPGGETIKLFAVRDIVAGEEITFCYEPDLGCKTRHERHQALRFVCDCKACLTGTSFQKLSDMRRTLIRGLQYLMLGVDLDGQRQNSASPIIVDSELKKAAEVFSIPLSARLIYSLLVISLLETEGLLDRFMVERLGPGVWRTVASFRTVVNTRIAKYAMVQVTWPERFWMACSFWGRRDVADHATTMQLRSLHLG